MVIDLHYLRNLKTNWTICNFQRTFLLLTLCHRMRPWSRTDENIIWNRSRRRPFTSLILFRLSKRPRFWDSRAERNSATCWFWLKTSHAGLFDKGLQIGRYRSPVHWWCNANTPSRKGYYYSSDLCELWILHAGSCKKRIIISNLSNVSQQFKHEEQDKAARGMVDVFQPVLLNNTVHLQVWTFQVTHSYAIFFNQSLFPPFSTQSLRHCQLWVTQLKDVASQNWPTSSWSEMANIVKAGLHQARHHAQEARYSSHPSAKPTPFPAVNCFLLWVLNF